MRQRPPVLPRVRRSIRPQRISRQFDLLEDRQLLALFTVTTSADNGNNLAPTAGSLRQAILASNAATPGPNTIDFNIAGPIVAPIVVPAELPHVTTPVLIDGYTQPGATRNTQLNGDNANLVITVTPGGSPVLPFNGLTIDVGGAGTTVQGLRIQGFNGSGIEADSNNNLIVGDFLLANRVDGVQILGASGNTIGGTAPADRNVIAGNGYGVEIVGVVSGTFIDAPRNQVLGNFIGTDASGTAAQGNTLSGVFINNASANTIGGAAAGASNIISGNVRFGVEIEGAGTAATQVLGNFIGTDITGATALGNGQGGVLISNTLANTVGGAAAGARNVISGNPNVGVELAGIGASSNRVLGNFIGTDATGMRALGVATGQAPATGVLLTFGANINTIGGTTTGARNVISGNTNSGVAILGNFNSSGFTDTPRNQVLGNFIGLAVDGATVIGNGPSGMVISNASANTVGGTASGARNVISGNAGVGLDINGTGSTGELVQGNFIGTDVGGTLPRGNTNHGVFVQLGASGNTIGGLAAGAGNTIAFNGGAGVNVGSTITDTTVRDAILSNSIVSNANLGIDLGADGVTPNTPGGHLAGPNLFQNFPVLVSAYDFGNRTIVSGTFNSAANTTFTVQLFSNDALDPTGFGEGQTLLAPTTVTLTTDGAGNATFNLTFPTGAPAGRFLTATATDPNGNTSEFSRGLLVSPAFVVTNTNDSGAGSLRQAILNADFNPGLDTITFAIPGAGLQTIQVATALPAIADPVVINGYSQPGSSPNTLPNGDNASVLVAVTPGPNLATAANGLTIAFAGAGTTVRGLRIQGFNGSGIEVDSNNNVLAGNFLLANRVDGVLVLGASGNVIGGTAPADRNLIAGNLIGVEVRGFFDFSGIFTDAPRNQVLGNFIGTDATGAAALANNLAGVFINNASANTIGGAAAGARNIISGNTNYGVEVLGARATATQVLGNFIGVDVTGATALGNRQGGVQISNAPANTVGGAAAGARNVISGNPNVGVVIEGTGASSNRVLGNFIGTDAAGRRALGVSTGQAPATGVLLTFGASFNTIGGLPPGARNVISGNGNAGVLIIGTFDDSGRYLDAPRNQVLGNYIGITADGATALGNTLSGVIIDGASTNTVGGTAAGARNIISGNRAEGVLISGTTDISGIFTDAPRNQVLGNFIGTDATGTQQAGNGRDGVFIDNAFNNIVGGILAGAGNTIAHNVGAGVHVNVGASDAILFNSIFANAGGGNPRAVGGILLTSRGNLNQTPPVLTSFLIDGANTTIQGTLAVGTPGTTFRVEFFANDALDPNGLGEGQTPLGFITVTPNGSGVVPISFTVPTASVVGKFITATATDARQNTSEFSAPLFVNGAGRLAFSMPTFQVFETDGTATVTVIRTNGSFGTVSVAFATSDGTARAGIDYLPTSGILTFAPGVTSQSFPITILDALLISGSKTINVTLGPPTGGAVLGPQSTAVVTIIANDNLVVTNTNDSGFGSLRRAILIADNPENVGLNTITFAIPGPGVHIIQPGSALPAITRPAVIDGYSQPGARPNTQQAGDDASLLIVIDGQRAQAGEDGVPPNGLLITAGSSVVQGLNIRGFGNAGIRLEGGGGDIIRGNFIGTGAAAEAALGNGTDGVFIAGASSNIVGGTAPADRNIISGNASVGVQIFQAAGNAVLGNFIGTDATGTARLGNVLDGVFLNDAPNNAIGGTQPGSRNVISGNGSVGIQLFGAGASGVVIAGNFIGTDATGTARLGNVRDGIFLNNAPNNVVGGVQAGTGNVISANGSVGVHIFGAGGSGNVILGNFIGTDATGTARLGNVRDGVFIESAANSLIGGTVATAANVIGANGFSGVDIAGAGATGNAVLGNFIGTNATGSPTLGNLAYGVLIDGTTGNTVGGVAPNVIANNRLSAVQVLINGLPASDPAATGNRIGPNVTFNNDRVLLGQRAAPIGNTRLAGVVTRKRRPITRAPVNRTPLRARALASTARNRAGVKVASSSMETPASSVPPSSLRLSSPAEVPAGPASHFSRLGVSASTRASNRLLQRQHS